MEKAFQFRKRALTDLISLYMCNYYSIPSIKRPEEGKLYIEKIEQAIQEKLNQL